MLLQRPVICEAQVPRVCDLHQVREVWSWEDGQVLGCRINPMFILALPQVLQILGFHFLGDT